MKPINWSEANCMLARDQEEYMPLPVRRDDDGRLTSCWELSWRERLMVLVGFPLFITMLTFNHPPQPILPRMNPPE